jgi:large subunit ribosomal protein L24
MKYRVNDTVIVTAGKDKGKTGKILRFSKDKKKVVVEGINIVKRHVKPGVVNEEGGIIEFEKPIDLSNIMLSNEDGSEVYKPAFKRENKKKIRIDRKTGKEI